MAKSSSGSRQRNLQRDLRFRGRLDQGEAAERYLAHHLHRRCEYGLLIRESIHFL